MCDSDRQTSDVLAYDKASPERDYGMKTKGYAGAGVKECAACEMTIGESIQRKIDEANMNIERMRLFRDSLPANYLNRGISALPSFL